MSTEGGTPLPGMDIMYAHGVLQEWPGEINMSIINT